MNTKKSVYLIIISLLAIGAIVFGAYKNIKSLSFGTIRQWINDEAYDDDWDDYFDDDDFDEDDNDFHRSNKIDGSLNRTFDNFTTLKINANVIGVVIREGTEFSIESQYNKEYLKPVINLDDGVLSISQRTPKKMSGNNNARIVIYIPRFHKMDKVDIRVDVGEVNIYSLYGENLKINNDVGEINLKDISFDNVDVKSDVGEIDIELATPLSEYSLELETKVGEIEVGNILSKRKYETKGVTKKVIKAKTKIGEISVE